MRPRISMLAVAAWVLAGTAIAEVEEAMPAHEAHSALAPLVFSTINLLIFLWVLARFVLPPIRNWVHNRRSHIVQALEQAAAAKAEALRLQKQWEQRLADFDAEVEAMRVEAQHDSARERERLLEAARKMADTIRRDAELAAAYEVRRTQEQLRAELVRQAVQLAEQAARTQLTPDDQRRFVNEFLKQVES